ncbi:uncharacterized protein VTP21DRAFT_9306 [Calcarisporiella thermophila]|uniref:uncharacterized protein n=1 Tax=Calcarisporiella thermophila TaxID=911321 RepID=UPI0037432C32
MFKCLILLLYLTLIPLVVTQEESVEKRNKDKLMSKWVGIPLDTPPLKFYTVITDGVDLFDLTSLATMADFIPNSVVKTVGESRTPIRSGEGLVITPDHSFNETLDDIDVLCIVAGVKSSPALNAWLHRVVPTVKKYVFTICAGSMTLANSGLLDGHRATGLKAAWPLYLSAYPKVKWVQDVRFIEDGKFITTSGGAAGLDGSFYLLSKIHGGEVARRVAEINEYEWRSDPTNAPFSDNYVKFPYPGSIASE